MCVVDEVEYVSWDFFDFVDEFEYLFRWVWVVFGGFEDECVVVCDCEW